MSKRPLITLTDNAQTIKPQKNAYTAQQEARKAVQFNQPASEEEDLNDDICFKCKNVGQLICCTNCNRAYHRNQSCLSSHQIVDEHQQPWRCPCCQDHQKCPYCEQYVDVAADSPICTVCERYAHLDCVPLPKEITHETKDKALILNQPKYIICQLCIKECQINLFITFKNYLNTTYHLVKPYFMSAIHRGWFTEEFVSKNYKPTINKNSDGVYLGNIKHNKPYSQPTIEKIVNFRPKMFYKQFELEALIERLTDPKRQIYFSSNNNFKFLIKWTKSEDLPLYYSWQDEYVARTNQMEFKKFIFLKKFEVLIRKNIYELNEDLTKYKQQLRKSANTVEIDQKFNQLKEKYSKKESIVMYLPNLNSKYNHILQLLNYIDQKLLNKYNQFIIITREEKILHWQNLIKLHCPSFNSVTYTGKRSNRELIRKCDFYFFNTKFPKFNILITTIEDFTKDYQIIINQIALKLECIIFDNENIICNQKYRQPLSRVYAKLYKIIIAEKQITDQNVSHYCSFLNIAIKNQNYDPVSLLKHIKQHLFINGESQKTVQHDLHHKVVKTTLEMTISKEKKMQIDNIIKNKFGKREQQKFEVEQENEVEVIENPILQHFTDKRSQIEPSKNENLKMVAQEKQNVLNNSEDQAINPQGSLQLQSILTQLHLKDVARKQIANSTQLQIQRSEKIVMQMNKNQSITIYLEQKNKVHVHNQTKTVDVQVIKSTKTHQTMQVEEQTIELQNLEPGELQINKISEENQNKQTVQQIQFKSILKKSNKSGNQVKDIHSRLTDIPKQRIARKIRPSDKQMVKIAENNMKIVLDNFDPTSISQLKKVVILRFVLSFGVDFESFQELYSKLIIFQKDVFDKSTKEKEILNSYLQYFLALLRFQDNYDDDQCRQIKSCFFDLQVKLKLTQLTFMLKRIIDLQTLKSFYNSHSLLICFFEKFYICKNRKGEKRYAFSWTTKDDIQLIHLMLTYGIGRQQIICENFRQQKPSTHPQLIGLKLLIKKLLTNAYEISDKETKVIRLIGDRINYLLQFVSKNIKMK